MATDSPLYVREVLENIVVHLPPAQIHACIRLSKQWKKVITTTPAIREKAWMPPTDSGSQASSQPAAGPSERWELVSVDVPESTETDDENHQMRRIVIAQRIRWFREEVGTGKDSYDASALSEMTSLVEANRTLVFTHYFKKAAPSATGRNLHQPVRLNPFFEFNIFTALPPLPGERIFRREIGNCREKAALRPKLPLRRLRDLDTSPASFLDTFLTSPPVNKIIAVIVYKVGDEVFRVKRHVEAREPLTVRQAMQLALSEKGVIFTYPAHLPERSKGLSARPIASYHTANVFIKDAERGRKRGSEMSVIQFFSFWNERVAFPSDEERAMVEAEAEAEAKRTAEAEAEAEAETQDEDEDKTVS